MKKLKLYHNKGHYNTDRSSFEWPVVSFINDTNTEVKYMGDPYWKCTYKVTTTSDPTLLCMKDCVGGVVSYNAEAPCVGNTVRAIYYNGENILSQCTTVQNGWGQNCYAYKFPALGYVDVEIVYTNAFYTVQYGWVMCPNLIYAQASQSGEVIGSCSFYGTSIKQLHISKNVTCIGYQAIKNTYIEALEFEEGPYNLEIGFQAISGGATGAVDSDANKAIKVLNFKNRVKRMGFNALKSLPSIETIIFGPDFEMLNGGCDVASTANAQARRSGSSITQLDALKLLVFKGTTPPTVSRTDPYNADYNHIMLGNPNFNTSTTKPGVKPYVEGVTGKILVPKSAVDTYKAADGFSEYADYIFAIEDNLNLIPK